MNKTLTEQFNAFVDRRIHQVDFALENDALYQEKQCSINDISNIPDDVLPLCEDLQSINAQYAYKQGFIDGLTLMAGLGACD